jgi:Tol biopolymer transport system component/predicted Ser/Thr protein kinase
MLTPGTRLGPYEIVATLGAGGMGEVYRARDTRLGREVALKLLPDPANRERFEQEARAVAALSHPNIVAVFDVGENYFVSELVEGDSLRNLPPVPVRKAVDLAAQVADGLAAAHAAGVVHRDLKPENIMVTRDGRAKILDFGLAKVETPKSDPDATLLISKTGAGVVMGTVGYMSPEQVRGRPADARSDIFSFGLVLYEMLGGARAFKGDSAVETMNAILSADPPPLPPATPPALAQIVDHCIEKNPAERFQSARDLAFNLRAFGSQTQLSGPEAAIPKETAKRRKWPWIAAAAALVVAVAGFATFRNIGGSPKLPEFTRLTFDRGYVSGARFDADAKLIAYSASWAGSPFQMFAVHGESHDSHALSISNAHIFAISGGGELAIAVAPTLDENSIRGTLARIPLAGGAPRPVAENVYAADFEPRSDRLAIVRMVDGVMRVEFPQGKVLYQTAGWISVLRFSPDGKRLAIGDHPLRFDNRGDVAVLDLDGHKTIVSGGWEAIDGIAWRTNNEVWFAAAVSGGPQTLYAATLDGRRRQVLTSPSSLRLEDISADGRVLINSGDGQRGEITGISAASGREQNLSYRTLARGYDLSSDGKTLLLTDFIAGQNYAACVRKTDGSPVVVLGDGQAEALSPDGRWALSIVFTSPPELLVIPTGVGDTVHVPKSGLDYADAAWFPDSKRILFSAREGGKTERLYTQDVFPPGAPHPLTGDGMTLPGKPVSPDGKLVVAKHLNEPVALYSIENGASQPIAGVNPQDQFIRWAPDGDRLFFTPANPRSHASIS